MASELSEDQNGSSGQVNIQYSMPGILHFLQTEWTKFDMERAQWEVERAEMQARIAFLQGERKAQENLKKDLVRRIKMLEIALRKEREKFNQLKDSGDSHAEKAAANLEDDSALDGDLLNPSASTSNPEWKFSRQLLRQYLTEIGYGETVVNVRSARVRAMLGIQPMEGQADSADEAGGRYKAPGRGGVKRPEQMNPAESILLETERSIMDIDFLGGREDDDNDETDDPMKDAKLDDSDTEEALAEFDVMINEATLNDAGDGGGQSVGIGGDGSKANASDEWSSGVTTKVRTRKDRSGGEKRPLSDELNGNLLNKDEFGLGELAHLGNTDGKPVGIDSKMRTDSESQEQAKTWENRYTLRSHFDAVRAVAFHPVEQVLFTASEDETLKMWNLQKAMQYRKSSNWEVEPAFTFRGHVGPVLCLSVSPTGEQCYSGGMDGAIRVWNLPQSNIDPYESFDASIAQDVLSAHEDAVWDMVVHSSRLQLLSCSADGTVCLSAPVGVGRQHSLVLKTYHPDSSIVPIPKSIDFSYADHNHMIAAYDNQKLVVFDLETAKPVTTFDVDALGGESALLSGNQINRVISHPALNQTITAHEDRSIRLYDNVSGKQIHRFTAHLDSVTSVAMDPNGLYLLSGSHDSSIRIWNYEARRCIQEITAHRKKLDESIHDVCFHPTKPFLASAGADGLAKVFV